ncbi:hypothetical protein GHT06_021823 [Daphnia sinensis]|uniref:Uncharacterized protein n=1 Tax=Daphnia sinensis TaxID=1820382 RepID=A0AAD5PQE8_9CRUS|nr:hypothetical protein GHT06_021823 [Daphnia sinensis]
MKYLLFFTLALMAAITSSTEGCMSEVHSANHKADNSHEIDDIDDVSTTVKPSVVANTTVKPSIVTNTTHVETTTTAKHSNETAPSTEAGHSAGVVHTTEKPIVVVAENMNTTTQATVAEKVTSTPMMVTSMKPVVVFQNTTEKPVNVIHEEVNKTSATTPVAMTTVAAVVNSTEKPIKLTPEMTTSAPATIPEEMSTHIVNQMNINKTTVMTTSSMPMVVTAATVIRRERRQVNNATTKVPTTPKTPVFGSRFPTRVPTPPTRKARQGTTVGPAMAASRTTTKPKMVTKQPAGLSPVAPSRVRTPSTMKPQPVTTGSMPVRG